MNIQGSKVSSSNGEISYYCVTCSHDLSIINGKAFHSYTDSFGSNDLSEHCETCLKEGINDGCKDPLLILNKHTGD